MRKYLILSIIILVMLSGCGIGDFNSFVVPNDTEFRTIMNNLSTPKKTCSYMADNFTFKFHPVYAPDPYELWENREGDCNDFAWFVIFMAHYHGYEVYRIKIKESFFKYHSLGVFVEDGFYTSSSNMSYYPWSCETFREIVNIHRNDWISYQVYDYEKNLIEVGKYGG